MGLRGTVALGTVPMGLLSKTFYLGHILISENWSFFSSWGKEEVRNLESQSGKLLGHNPVVKGPSHSSVEGFQEIRRPDCSVRQWAPGRIRRTSVSACSEFNNPNAYRIHSSVNPDLPFKSLASMFIKKSDRQWPGTQCSWHCLGHFISALALMCFRDAKARAQWWENNLLEKSSYSMDFSVELGDGKRELLLFWAGKYCFHGPPGERGWVKDKILKFSSF